MPFRLKSGVDQFDFDIDGSVSKGGTRVGTWAVTPDNKVKLTKDAGGETTFDVEWQVNNLNQLELLQNGASAFNFHGAPNVRPMYSTANADLSVQPNRNQIFKFGLHGAWTFSPDFLLKFKVGNRESTFDGFLNDSDKSAFSYHFSNKAKATQGFDLVFTGQWAHISNSLELKFVYDKEADAGGAKTGVFDLPSGLSLEPSANQLFYKYSKASQTHSVQLTGRLIIGADFRITYVLDD